MLAALPMLLPLLVPAAVPAAAQELAPDVRVTHLAGADGEGPARTVTQVPTDLLVEGDRLLVADSLWGVIRETDLVSGVQRILHDRSQLAVAALGAPADAYYGGELNMARALDGGLFVSQRAFHRVIKIAPDGTAAVVAGDGRRGLLGDGGPATAASLTEPRGLAVARDGSLLIADAGNHAVRRVALDGTISTFAGSSTDGSTGCDFAYAYYAAPGSRCPVRGSDGDGGQATHASLDGPSKVRVGPDQTIYVGSHRALRGVAPDGTIRTIAGGGPDTPRLGVDDPCAISGHANDISFGVVDALPQSDGSLLLATSECLHRVDGRTGAISRFAGGSVPIPQAGPNSGAGSDSPLSLVDGAVAGTAGGLLVAEPHQARVRLLDADAAGTVVAGLQSKPYRENPDALKWHYAAGDGGPAVSAQLPHVTGMATDPATGDLHVSDSLARAVRRIDVDGLTRGISGGISQSIGDGVHDVGSTPVAADMVSLAGPLGITSGAGVTYVVDELLNRVLRMRDGIGVDLFAGGSWECKPDHGDGDMATSTELYGPVDVSVAADGGLYLLESPYGLLRHIDAAGRMHVLSGPRSRPCPEPGQSHTSWSYGDDPLADATAVAAGRGDEVWVTTPTCLRRWTPTVDGECVVPLTPAPFPRLQSPFRLSTVAARISADVVVDADGSVVFSDPWASIVRRLRSDGTVETVAGGNGRRCAQDDVLASTAGLGLPTQLALLADGAVAVADAECRTVHRIGAPRTETVERAAGPDRLATAAHVSRAGFDDLSAGAVVLARADEYADALTGTPLAARHRGPLLLTSSSSLSPWAESELRRVLPPGGTVYLLGGQAALSDAVTARVRRLGYAVVRLAGPNRYETAATVARDGLGGPSAVLLTTGTGFADALSAAVAAAKVGGAILLTEGARMPDATRTYLREHPGQQYAIGGLAAAAAPAAAPLVGADRYATAAEVAKRFFPDAEAVALATGRGFADALSGGALIASRGGPLLLTAPGTLPAPTQDWLRTRSRALTDVVVIGGDAAVSTQVRQAAVQAAR